MTCTETPPILAGLVDLFLGARRAWVLVSEVPYAIDQLRDEGYLVIWERPSGDAVTWSAWGAAVLGLKLTDANATNCYRWIRTGRPDPDPPRRPRPRAAPPVDQVVDQRPGPVESAIAAEESGPRPRRPPGDGPRPSVLLMGPGLWPWTESPARGETRPALECDRCCPSGRKRKARPACECGRGGRPAAFDGVCRPCFEGRCLERGGRKVAVPRPPAECVACRGGPLSRPRYCLRCGRSGRDADARARAS